MSNEEFSVTSAQNCIATYFDAPLPPAVPAAISKLDSNVSRYEEPIGEGLMRGNSRDAGDAPEVTKHTIVGMLLAGASSRNYSPETTANLLATVAIESGFNPDAAAVTTSAAGLGQFLNDTGAALGITDQNRWNVPDQLNALFKLFDENMVGARRLVAKGDKMNMEDLVYALHHDGPSLQYGGRKIATEKVAPIREQFREWLDRLAESCSLR